MAEELSVNQKRALRALLTCPSISQASRECGLGRRTLWRYLGQPEFRAALSKEQDALVGATTAALVGLSGDALAVLQEAMTGEDVPIGIKTRVARDWVSQMRKGVELADLAERVAALEKKANI